MARYQHSAEDVPDDLQIPKGSWHGLVGEDDVLKCPRLRGACSSRGVAVQSARVRLHSGSQRSKECGAQQLAGSDSQRRSTFSRGTALTLSTINGESRMNQTCRKRFAALAVTAAVLASPLTAWPASDANKSVTIVQSPDNRECIFFQLEGVSVADPATPGTAWFSVSQSHAGYKEIVAALMMARATGAPLQNVTTTGSVACGHAEVSSVAI